MTIEEFCNRWNHRWNHRWNPTQLRTDVEAVVRAAVAESEAKTANYLDEWDKAMALIPLRCRTVARQSLERAAKLAEGEEGPKGKTIAKLIRELEVQ
jgi:hypothetical protein